MKLKYVAAICIFILAPTGAWALSPEPKRSASASPDWLIDSSSYIAGVYQGEHPDELVLSNGLIRRTFRLAPNAATVAFDNLATGESMLRGVKPEALLVIDGKSYEVGGLRGQPNYAYLLPEWLDDLEANPDAFHFTGYDIGKPVERLPWKRVRHHAPNAIWPPAGVALRMDYRAPQRRGLRKLLPGSSRARDITVSVHYELYDGLPVISKRITVSNNGDDELVLDAFTSELLALVEYASEVETRQYAIPRPNIHVETDFAFASFNPDDANHHVVHWEPDPQYETQVNYLRLTPNLLQVSPELGPQQRIAPGESLESFFTFVMPRDSYERERNGLAQRRMYRVLAPWSTENPLMLHARFADWKRVKTAIDQAADVGFEMVILTFGSGFDIEDDSASYLEKMRGYAQYAASKGVELGGYSLLASRSLGRANDVVMPPGETPVFGKSPCLQSRWGQDYFSKLYRFYELTGFVTLEHDGSYPGDVCASTDHPGHHGLEDSRWNQYQLISEFYRWSRGQGIYLTVPDHYYLAGSNKNGMGYRETNWSLPRAQQVIHTRQNIHDGSWQRTSSMGWMFVPLTEYHGGGAAATIEPLREHLEHYRLMMLSNMGMGVQAAYRGPRLFDTDQTKAMVSDTVAWYKKYRDILESDMVHGRRADGRDVDWMLHVNPELEHRGMLVVYNPLKQAVTRTVNVDLYYTGLTDKALIRQEEGAPRPYTLSRDYSVDIEFEMAANSFTWFLVEAPKETEAP